MKHITEDDIEDLALGAVVLGAGGGGDPWIAKIMLREAIRRHGPIPLVDPDELDPEGLVLSVGMVGAPTAIIEQFPNGDEVPRVLDSMAGLLGRPGAAVMPIEVGGMNTLFPLAAAAHAGLPCVDADAMRRAFPQIEMTLLTLAGHSVSPVALADVRGNDVIVQSVNNATAELFTRTNVMNMGMVAVLCAYPLATAEVASAAALGSVSYCLELGKRLHVVAESGTDDALEDFLGFADGREIFAGVVVDVERRTVDGFARGTVVLSHIGDPDRLLRIEIQNENLIAVEDGVPIVTVPDLITLLDTETSTPVTTEMLAYGQRLRVIGIAVHERWLEPDGLALAGPRAFGYDLDHIPVGGTS